ncbi:MAG: hypothetical protein LBS18_04830 [Clostridiales bacterium]|jgi:hypothetical protein|nr:hypothetical protein [Clostridiales bacterium]
MSRKTFITVIAAAVCVIAAAGAILVFSGNRRGMTRLSKTRALQEMPLLFITGEEYALMRAAREDATVKEILASQQNEAFALTILQEGDRARLLGPLLPEGAVFGDFAVTNKTVVIEYMLQNDRVVLECLPGAGINKTIMRYDNAADIANGGMALYTNNDNAVFQYFKREQ